MSKSKPDVNQPGVQELCRRLKAQLDELSVVVERRPTEAELRMRKLFEELKQKIGELSR